MPLTRLGLMSRSYYADPSYAGVGDAHDAYVGRYQRSGGVEPVLYLHGPNVDAASSQTARFQETFNAVAANAYPVLVPDTGSGAQWATTDMVGTSGYIDDVLTWASSNAALGTANVAAGKVGLYGYLNGALNALNWAWRNPGKVRSIVLLAPIVDPGAFYTANPTWQASIDADWGTHGAFTTALPTIDPMQNLALIEPFAHRILCVYSPDDEYVDPDGVLAFAELVGAETLEVAGVSAMVANTAAEAAAMWTLRKMRDRPSVYVAWDESDLANFDVVPATTPNVVADNVNVFRTTDRYGAGRRGEFVRVSGTEGNERHLLLHNGLSAPDVAVTSTWWNDNGLLHGQPGNIMRGHIDADAGTFLVYIAWADIVFRIPWWVNRGKWSGTVDDNDLVLTQVESGVIPGLRLNAGGEVLASKREGNVVTLTVRAADADRNFRTGVLETIVTGLGGGFDVIGVQRIDANHLQFANVGADVPSGGPGLWADFGSGYPYNVHTELRGGTMLGVAWPPHMDRPDFGDPDYSWTWTESGSPLWAGYGRPGQMAGHVGIDQPDGSVQVPVQFGPSIYQEL